MYIFKNVLVCFKSCTSGKSVFKDIMKNEMTLAVPGTVVCIVNKRCNVVEVKKPNMIIKLRVEALLEKYLTIALKCLLIPK